MRNELFEQILNERLSDRTPKGVERMLDDIMMNYEAEREKGKGYYDVFNSFDDHNIYDDGTNWAHTTGVRMIRWYVAKHYKVPIVYLKSPTKWYDDGPFENKELEAQYEDAFDDLYDKYTTDKNGLISEIIAFNNSK